MKKAYFYRLPSTLLLLLACFGNSHAQPIADLEQRVEMLESQISDLRNLVDRYEELLSAFSVETVHGHPTVRLTGVNFQVVNGTGFTETKNGTGNILIGYDELNTTLNTEHCSVGSNPNTGAPILNEADCLAVGGRFAKIHKDGSHYLVLGTQNNYSRWSGIIAGRLNTVNNDYASVFGGVRNSAYGQFAHISGGFENTAVAGSSAILGGEKNRVLGGGASVVGGYENEISGIWSSLLGGENNSTVGAFSTVSGGRFNAASGHYSSVLGGNSNFAGGENSSIGGGIGNFSDGILSFVGGGQKNRAIGGASVVSGGSGNDATATFSTVSGGQTRNATGEFDWVAGSLFEDN